MRKFLISATIAAAGMAMPSWAQDDASGEAPAYYLDGVFALAAAENVARFCPTLSINLEATSALTTTILTRLTDDGIVPDDIPRLDGVEEGFASRQTVFMAKHDLEGADVPTVCAAGMSEIEEETAVGLLMVAGDGAN